MTLGHRLRLVRDQLGETQKSMSKRFALGEVTWQSYELDNRPPKGEVLASLVQLGFDANWILTGEGTMMGGPGGAVTLPESRPSGFSEDEGPAQIAAMDRDLMEKCIAAALDLVEEWQAGWSHEKAAKFALLLYDAELGAQAEGRSGLSGAEVIRLFRQVA